MDIQKERAAFEKHWIENFDAIDLEDAEYRDDLNMYEHPTLFADDLNKAWSSWQAAKTQAIPADFVLMPKTPTEKMLSTAIHKYLEVNDLSIITNRMFHVYNAMVETMGNHNA